MLAGHSIRPLTQAERDKRQEEKQERYDAMYAEVEQLERDEYEREFSERYRNKHPFTPDGARIHAITLQKLREQNHDHE